MDFGLSEQQQKWYDAAVRFARDELVDAESVAREQRGEFWREGYERCGRFGILGLPIPSGYGGQGTDIPTAVAAMEGLGYGCPDTGLLFALNASLWTITMPILTFGTEAQKARYLPRLCDGRSFGANGASEPEAGSDIFSMTTRAVRRGDRWVLNGRKVWITGGPIADVFLCFTTTDPSKGVLGITAFLINRDTPGFHVVREIPKLGMRTAPMGELVFEDCELPAENLLGREGRGSRIFNAALEWERGAILASVVGTMRRQLDRCIQQARTRKQFGQPIGKFQSVSNRIVDMMARLDQPVDDPALRLAQARGQRRHDRGLDGKATRFGVLRPEQPGRGSYLRRLGLHCRVGPGARCPRQRGGRPLLGHQRHAAQHHRPALAALIAGRLPGRWD